MRVLVALIAIIIAAPVSAASIATDHIEAEIVVRQSAVAPGEVADLLVAHDIADGWHTYWLNPGDSGEPPRLTFTLPSGGEAAPVRFPAPERLPYPPLMNHGYKGEFALLTGVRVPADWPTGTPYTVGLAIDWLVCEAICIPESGQTTVTIPTAADTTVDSTVAFRFMQAEWALPELVEEPARYTVDGDTLAIALPVADLTDPSFFAHDRDAIDHAAPQTLRTTADGPVLSLTVGRTAPSGPLSGVLTSAGEAYAILAVPPDGSTGSVSLPAAAIPAVSSGDEAGASLSGLTASAPVAPSVDASVSIAQAVLFALIGGLILNLMPCVFPVLALKAFGLVSHADATFSRRAAVAGAYTGGILTTFAILCGVLLALKATGVAVGWGFQLQSPPFVAAMALVLFAVGLNLSGVYEIGTSLTRAGGAGQGEGLKSAFATGALATVVATPCTAPFMAVAIGAALAAPAGAAMAVFAALGIGLALPFALLCLVPGLARILPRPGPWMVRLRQALAFPVYATAAWLVWVLVQLAPADAVLAALAAAVLLALALWLFGLAQSGSGRVAGVLALLALVASIGALVPTVTNGLRPVSPVSAADADAYSPERVTALRAEGRGVFVNATAAWCITCKVNEARIFDDQAFTDLLTETGVVFLTADWTRRDAAISRFLEGFGRAGVPLYVYYPAVGEPQVLPQILTLADLDSAFRSGPLSASSELP